MGCETLGKAERPQHRLAQRNSFKKSADGTPTSRVCHILIGAERFCFRPCAVGCGFTEALQGLAGLFCLANQRLSTRSLTSLSPSWPIVGSLKLGRNASSVDVEIVKRDGVRELEDRRCALLS